MSTHRFIVDVHFFDRTQWLPGEEVRFQDRLQILVATLLHGSTRGTLPNVVVSHPKPYEQSPDDRDSC